MDWVLFSETDRTDIDDLIQIYRESPMEAKIIYEMNKSKYVCTRVVRFNQGDDFQIAVMHRTFGIGKTNRMYNREVCLGSISYSKGKFHLIKRYKSKKQIQQLTYNNLCEFIRTTIPFDENMEINEVAVFKYVVERFGWIRFLDDNFLLRDLPFNTVVRHKLYSLNGALRFLFKAPLPAIKIWTDVFHNFEKPKVFSMWGEVRKVIYNIENMQREMVSNELFLDTCRMAGMLGKRVNCSWSLKRLKLEHDRWAREITQVILKYEKLRDLKISKIFLDFEAFSGYKLFKTNHELIAEGIMQNHCVGTYSARVDSGNTAIYHINGYTLQLTYNNNYYMKQRNGSKGLDNAQFRGAGNSLPPKELTDAVNAKIVEFNQMVNEEEYEPMVSSVWDLAEPF